MKIFNWIVVLLLFSVSPFYSQEKDSLVYFNELNFKSPFEKTTFTNYCNSTPGFELIDLFLTAYDGSVPDDPSGIHKNFNQYVEELREKTRDLNDHKKLKFIYKDVHRKYFRKYKLNNSFLEIFTKGEYNCVSGSAMYALIFEKLNIPYQAIEAPQHVFLVAFPETHKIIIEATMPKNGYITFNEKFKMNYLSHLYEYKIISKKEYESDSREELFQKYYFSENALNIKELAGIQYTNYFAYHLEENEVPKSFEDIKKSYYIAPTNRTRYLIYSTTSYLVHNLDYSDPNMVNYLKVMCRINNQKYSSDEAVRQEFYRLTHTMLTVSPNKSKYDSCYMVISKEIKDTNLLNDISFHYNYEIARMGYNNHKYGEYELNHLKAAFKINHEHTDLKVMIRGYFGMMIENSNDINYILKLLTEFKQDFPFLKEDGPVNSVYANCLLELCYQSFMMKNYKEGENYRSEFETLYDSSKDLQPGDNFIEKTYSTVATYYYKNGNRTKTKEVLKKGLSYAPGNFGLKARLIQLN